MRMVAPRTGAPEITIAEEQEQYQPLVAASYQFADGARGFLTRWRLTDQERTQIVAGEDLYLIQLTFGHPMQPVRLTVGREPWMEVEG